MCIRDSLEALGHHLRADPVAADDGQPQPLGHGAGVRHGLSVRRAPAVPPRTLFTALRNDRALATALQAASIIPSPVPSASTDSSPRPSRTVARGAVSVPPATASHWNDQVSPVAEDELPDSSVASAKRSPSVRLTLRSARSLNRAKVRSKAGPSKVIPSVRSASTKACRPECLPSTIRLPASPTSSGFMISYVVRSISTPCWWMPLSWLNALPPTTALFGCTLYPESMDTRREVRAISRVLTPVVKPSVGACVRSAITISSSAVLPARSPMPLTQTST